MKKSTIVTLLLLVPLPMSAEESATLSAPDTVAGFGTEIQVAHGPTETSFMITIDPPVGEMRELGIESDAQGAATVWLEGEVTETAGTYVVQLHREGSDLLAETSFHVLPDLLDTERSSIETRDEEATANEFRATVRVTLVDRYGNPLSRRPVQVISSIAQDRITGTQRETDSAGIALFTLSSKDPGTRTLQVIDLIGGTLLGSTATLTFGDPRQSFGGPMNSEFYGPGGMTETPPSYPSYPTYPMLPMPMYFPGFSQFPNSNPNPSPLAADLLAGKRFYSQVSAQESRIDRFLIEVTNRVDPQSIRAQDDFASLAITAIDAAGNRVDDYVGTVLLSSTDSKAVLPLEGRVQFEPRNLGRKQLTLGLAFKTPGEQWLRAVDSANPTIEGYHRFTVVGSVVHQAATLITIMSPTGGEVQNTLETTVKGNGPPFINIVVLGGKEELATETDRDGFFSVTLALDPAKTEHVIKVRDELGKYESEEVTITTDVKAPKAERISFTPENPEEETDVLLVVETEPDVKTATVTLEGAHHALTVSGTDPQKYQVLLRAPKAGTYDVVITLADELGNTTEVTQSLRVTPKGLPRVIGVEAVAEPNAVALSWKAMEEIEIDGYRIYVGTSAADFLYTLDTDRPTTAATVAGLRPGTTYYFAVSALQEERESEAKSDVVSAMPLGLTISVTPQESALLLEWSDLGDDLMLSSYALEYGVEPDVYTEKRILNGELRAFTLRDLINNIPYYLKLTPIATTGETLEDFTATAEGTPFTRIAGFRPSPGDPIPFELLGDLHAASPEGYAPAPSPPELSSEGIPVPLLATAGLAAAAVMAYVGHCKRRTRMVAAFLRNIEERYHS